MACGCLPRSRANSYRWTSDDGTETVIYPTEIQARAKVARRGGTYETVAA